jgi:hypothetical protein
MERLVSQWLMLVRDGANPPPFEEACFAEEFRPFMLDRSKYWFQLQPYRELFGDERILVLFTEDLENRDVFNKVAAFAGVSAFPSATNVKALNEAGTQTTPRGLIKTFQTSDFYQRVKRRLPAGLRKFARNSSLLNRPVDHAKRPKVSGEIFERLAEELRADAQAVLGYAGRTANHWRFLRNVRDY